jgi:apolipoprotein N-acyltransferase
LAFPKAQIYFLAFFFLVPLLLALEGQTRAGSFRIFFCFAFLANLILLYWIPKVMVRYGGASWILGLAGLIVLAAYLAVFSGLAGVMIRWGMERASGWKLAAWVPLVWIAKDLAVEKAFGGFPWCLAGYSQYANTWFVQWAEIGGVHLVSFILITANVLLYLLVKKRSRRMAASVAVFFLAVYAGGFLLLKSHAPASALHKAGIIQPNSDHDQVFDFDRIRKQLDRLFHVSQQFRDQGAEFVVWPEFTVPIYPMQVPHYRARFDAFSRSHIPLLAGFTDYGGGSGVFNSVMLFQVGAVQKYDKVHLTPFGEYVLFRRLLFFVRKITDEIGDFTPGKSLHNLTLGARQLSTPICYEIIYPELVRAMIAAGGEVIVTISNDSWFGNSSAPYQHLAMATLRCIENRRWLLRSTSNGISALVDPGGRIRRQSPLRREDHFLAQFQYLGGKTVFTCWGYLFPYGCLFLVLIGFLASIIRSKAKKPDLSSPAK